MKALLAHPGTQYAAKLAHELWQNGFLHRFWSGLALTRDRLDKVHPYLGTLGQRLNNRTIDIPPSHLRILPLLELSYLAKRSLGGESQRILHERNSSFQQRIPDEEINAVDVGIGFDTSSHILIDRFHSLGKPFIVDQTIAHPVAKARIFDDVRRQFPAWSRDLDYRLTEVRAAETQEHEKADLIVVASSFTQQTLIEQGVSPTKIVCNPYGVDLQRFKVANRAADRPFRFFFAGLISARKGVPLLFQAWRQLDRPQAELWLAGPVSGTAPTDWLGAVPRVKFFGKVSNAVVADLMGQTDIFVFPSYFEGFGLVLLEAMASGLPVITTTSTGGPDLFENGKGGWIVEAGDKDALITAMRYCVDHASQMPSIGLQARRLAEKFTWTAYGNRWAELLSRMTEAT